MSDLILSTEVSRLIDRSEAARKASCGLIQFLKNETGMTKLVQVYGLPLVGKTILGKQICDLVRDHCTNNDIPLKFTHVQYEDSIRSYTVQYSEAHKLSVLTSREDLERNVLNFSAGKCLTFLDDITHIEWVDGLLRYENCCCVLTTRMKLEFPRFGRQVYSQKLSPLTPVESENYMMGHLKPKEPSYTLQQISQNCEGFPRLLMKVTEALSVGEVSSAEVYQLSFLGLCAKFLSKDEHFQTYSKLAAQVKSVSDVVPVLYVPSLSVMRGSFGIPALAALSSISKTTITKRSLIDPLTKLGIISKTGGRHGENFIVSDIVRHLLEDRYNYLQNQSDLHNRFCRYFAKIFSDLEQKMRTDVDEFFEVFLGVYPNLLALVEKAVYCLKEEYDVLIQVGRQAELIIMSFLQAREVVTFYEACVQAAKERGNQTDYALMLSSYGHSLLVICPDIEIAGEKISEALDLMRKDPNISPTDIALTTSHKGHYYYLRGKAADSIRCYNEALSIYKKCLEELGPVQTTAEGSAQLRFLKLSMFRMKNNIAISSGSLGQYNYAIQLHQENIKMYEEMFQSNLGIGKAYHCIGLMLHLKGDKKGALKYSRRGLEIKRRSFPKRPSLSIIYSMSLVAASYLYSGERDVERTLQMLDDAIAMINDLQINHADRSLLINGKGATYLQIGRFSEARDYLKDAAEIRMAEFGVGANCCSGESLQLLGEAHFHLGEFHRAVATLKVCLCLELEYYKQSPKEFEVTILKTLEWLEKGLVKHGAEPSAVEFMGEFVTSTRDVLDCQAGEDAGLLFKAKETFHSMIDRASGMLDLKMPHSIATKRV